MVKLNDNYSVYSNTITNDYVLNIRNKDHLANWANTFSRIKEVRPAMIFLSFVELKDKHLYETRGYCKKDTISKSFEEESDSCILFDSDLENIQVVCFEIIGMNHEEGIISEIAEIAINDPMELENHINQYCRANGFSYEEFSYSI